LTFYFSFDTIILSGNYNYLCPCLVTAQQGLLINFMIKRNKLGQFARGGHPKTEFKLGHPKPENAYRFPMGNLINPFKKGNKVNLGRKRTEEFKQRISERMKGNTRGFQKGQEPWNYKGGRIIRKDGYILIKMSEHPSAMNSGYIFEHRYMVECILGRFLNREEIIHHINQIRDDNRPENLYLFPSNKSHRAYHILEKEGLIKPIIKSNLITLGRICKKL